MFQSLLNAQIFSKFNLKSGFWQFRIHPDDKYKTTFYIPDHHFQWTVMPFGLKNAPSCFQKVMIRIFQPLIHNALIYIYDILLFSKDKKSHVQLLFEFHFIIQHHGVMLSKLKMILT